MWAYLGVYSVFSALGLGASKRAASPLLLLALAFLLWFMGARYLVGCDFNGYVRRFNIASDTLVLSEILGSAEPGFELLITSVKASGLDYMWLNIFASAIILFGFANFLKSFRFPLLILALLFPIMIVQLSMSGIRQGIAVALVMGSAASFIHGRRIQTAIWILAAATFHSSAAIFLPLALVAGRRVSLARLIAAVVLLLPAAFFLGGERFETYQDRYVDQIYGEVSSGGALIRYAMILLPAAIFIANRKKFREAFPRQFELFTLFAIITLATGLTGFISSLALHRLNYYTMPFSIVMFAYASVVLGGRRGANRLLFKMLPVALYGGYMLFWLATSEHADLCYIPYQSYSFGSDAAFAP